MDIASNMELWNILEHGFGKTKVEILPGIALKGQEEARKRGREDSWKLYDNPQCECENVDCDLGKWEDRE